MYAETREPNDVGVIDHLQNVNLVRDIPFHDLDSSCIALKRLAVCWVLKWRQACTERFAVPKQKSKDCKYKNEQISTYPNTRMHPIVIGRAGQDNGSLRGRASGGTADMFNFGGLSGQRNQK